MQLIASTQQRFRGLGPAPCTVPSLHLKMCGFLQIRNAATHPASALKYVVICLFLCVFVEYDASLQLASMWHFSGVRSRQGCQILRTFCWLKGLGVSGAGFVV